MHAIDAPERGKRTRPAQKPQRQLLHLADLTLVLRHGLVRHGEGCAGVDLVRVQLGAEHVQLALACGAVAQPRVDAAFDGRPVRDDEHLTRRRYQRRTQHGLQDVGDSFAELRRNRAAACHRLSDGLGVIGAHARKVVRLQAIARRAARGRATSEHERPTHTMIFVIRKVGHTPELGCAAGPQIIGCLDDLGHIGGHVFMVFFG